jgi:hypothetical protein
LLLVFLGVGITKALWTDRQHRILSVIMLLMVMVLFAFFSILVPTRMPAFVYPVSSVIMILIAYGIYYSALVWADHWKLTERNRMEMLVGMTFIAGLLSLKPNEIIHERSSDNVFREMKLHNAALMKNLKEEDIAGRVIFNTKAYENIELMFYRDVTAYHWYPQQSTIDSLKNLGNRLVAFQHASQYLPDYMLHDPDIKILVVDFK